MTTAAFERRYESLRGMVNRRLAALATKGRPQELRDACRYILKGGGKRIRAVLLLLASESAGGSARRALDAAAAVEVLHNFTLVHDDVMDNATERRGRPTVHLRWNLNTALLAGDILVGMGYRLLLRGTGRRSGDIARVYTDGLIAVCEGQGMDLAFERIDSVTPGQYFRMIGKKTAALLSAALEIGGILGGAGPRERATLRRFGRYLGIAFQLQDDLLDVVADRRHLGKQIGGDILERKKTYLLLRAVQRARGGDARFLRRLINTENDAASLFPGERLNMASARHRVIEHTTDIYRRTGALEDARTQIRQTTGVALRALASLPAGRPRDMLSWLAERLVYRDF